ncbi:Peptidyl-prolyl cis-trans isomerase E [Neolecta irregularis DAH-3]|uniref:Peptidyl-prolyl cis-trans isomerase E n=1 Tax=Neolecta irregularis (strain DAH-3) TaxID=1198029 RepID=A0A1U7LGP4_NEOID|nr:Peptidyl-prolyl cis-trans isomerase E [Neolecta irregularis DAH-3]|eukprot:OLL21824.1 Peptidyl-prolyl cis-trans isomerase E [Neolecta irregularis DAH-3]
MASTNQKHKSTVYVAGLSEEVTKDILHAAFIPFGDVVEIELQEDRDSGILIPGQLKCLTSSGKRHRGFAYVEFESPMDARAAIDNMDQAELFGRVIRAQPAKKDRENFNGLDSDLPVWQQEDWLRKHAIHEEDKGEQPDAVSTEPVYRDPREAMAGLDLAGPNPES